MHPYNSNKAVIFNTIYMKFFTLKNTYSSYFKLSIDEKINLRQFRNSLNINGLFYCCLTTNWNQSDMIHKTYPKINNGLYHHIGKNHSKYNNK